MGIWAQACLQHPPSLLPGHAAFSSGLTPRGQSVSQLTSEVKEASGESPVRTHPHHSRNSAKRTAVTLGQVMEQRNYWLLE